VTVLIYKGQHNIVHLLDKVLGDYRLRYSHLCVKLDPHYFVLVSYQQ